MKHVTALSVMLLAVGLYPKPIAAGADWPMFIGDGDRTPPKQRLALIEHLDDAPYPMEDRLLVFHDRAHTDPVVASWWSISDTDRPRPLHGPVGFGPRTITGYEVPIQWPYVDGLLYARTLDGLACFDLRKPAAAPGNQTLHMTIPARIAGTREDLHATLTQRDGRLTHGGFRQSRRLHAVDISRAKWDGRQLTGLLGIDVNAYRRQIRASRKDFLDEADVTQPFFLLQEGTSARPSCTRMAKVPAPRLTDPGQAWCNDSRAGHRPAAPSRINESGSPQEWAVPSMADFRGDCPDRRTSQHHEANDVRFVRTWA